MLQPIRTSAAKTRRAFAEPHWLMDNAGQAERLPYNRPRCVPGGRDPGYKFLASGPPFQLGSLWQ